MKVELEYNVSICLRDIPGALDVEGRLMKLTKSVTYVTVQQNGTYKTESNTYLKTDSNVLTVLISSIIETTSQKLMRLTTSRKAWIELHKCF